VGAVAPRRSGARTLGPTGPVCPADGRSAAATHPAATAAKPRLVLLLSVPRTAPTTSTADASVSAEVMQPPLETSVVSGQITDPDMRRSGSTSSLNENRPRSNGLCRTKESRARPGMPDSHPSWRPTAMGVLSAKCREPLCAPPSLQVVLDRSGRSYVLSSRPVMCSRFSPRSRAPRSTSSLL
jgi:hypothetical protein